MAVNVPFQSATLATPAAGETIAADDVGGVKYQVVKLDVGANGASDPVVGTLPVSGSVAVSNLPATQPVSGPLTDAQLRAVAVPVSGSVSVSNLPATQPVSGPLTDTQLRAVAVPVSGSVSVSNFPATQPVSGPLTDAQLRAVAVPVSGPLTDAQLRALAVPVSAAALPLPSGAATEATLATRGAEATLATRLSESDFDTKAGSLTETAPATDTASSGLNGRLQRIAQRITSLIALVPAALGQGTMAQSFRVVLPSDQSSISVLDTPARLATYSRGSQVALAATATDVYEIIGSATKTVKIQRIQLSGIATAATAALISIIKRSAANTGGTSTTLTFVPHDSSDAAATSVMKEYSANPAGLGASLGIVMAFRLSLLAAASATAQPFTLEFIFPPARPFVLRGVAEVLSVNLNGVTIAGGTLACSVEITEE